MPSLFRFLTVVGLIGGIVYGVIFALAASSTLSERRDGPLIVVRDDV